ncbi:T6SS immunity protein Tdi1 domain-containing protein [Roseibium sediminicola]|uniref:DUF1851 domain-containing protein n=1 Tax=Roseibium sediminicola TaxID=2933272 RepID=A0ABT0GT79_9HYPH|nr:T6SS immunity protein Tdi1 domain-containing protein [Roseibium sp. CAU 1639]MCK7612651.1 DUF1851 domain-containing protein [Roseibium sp. CAU 1639]
MFQNFFLHFNQDKPQVKLEAALPVTLPNAAGLQVFLQRCAGQSFNNGLYRVHDIQKTGNLTGLTSEAFPEFSDRIFCFASDWLGRQFALDSGRIEAGEPLILMLEPGTGEVLELPFTFLGFHSDCLPNEADAALAEDFHRDWIAAGYAAPKQSQCVGYKRPLFLGGTDDQTNLEVTDLEVYWEISAQLLRRLRGLPPGTPIGNVTIG